VHHSFYCRFAIATGPNGLKPHSSPPGALAQGSIPRARAQGRKALRTCRWRPPRNSTARSSRLALHRARDGDRRIWQPANRCILAVHRIVKAGARHFNKIRNTTAKNRTEPKWVAAWRKNCGRQARGRWALQPALAEGMAAPESVDAGPRCEGAPDGGCRDRRGCQVPHAPLQAVRCIRIGGTVALGIHG
jgi:hypothetical protein